MTTATELYKILSTRTGITHGRVRHIGRRLIEARLLPASDGATVAQLNSKHVVFLLLALLIDAEGGQAPTLARQYYNLPAQNPSLASAGDSIRRHFDSFYNREN